MAKTISKRAAPATAAAVTSPEERRRMVAEAAYYRALQRGFSGGDAIEDWLAAEREIDERLLRMRRSLKQPTVPVLPAQAPTPDATPRLAVPSH